MKKALLGILLLLFVVPVIAQRFYVHDMFNGNYNSYDVGDEIELMLFDSSKNGIYGEITGLSMTSLYLNDDTVEIPLSRIAGIIKRKSQFGPLRILGFVSAYYLMISGGIYVVAGIISIPQEPLIGIAATGVGTAMAAGGALIKKRITKPEFMVKQQLIDNTTYRIFIE